MVAFIHLQPESCERGMGTQGKTFLPYVILKERTIQHDVLCDTKTDSGGWVVMQVRNPYENDEKKKRKI